MSVLAAAAVALILTAPASAIGASPSLEGYTGLLRTPSAWVEESGRMLFLVGQPGDPGLFAGGTKYALTLGFLRYLEVAAVETDWVGPGSDLSANLKLRVPLDLLFPGIPVGLAAGGQAIGGTADHFRTWYVVASARLWRFDGTVGWGSGPDRMKGVFGGLSLSVYDGVEILGDWDTQNLNVGAKASVSLDPLIGVPIRIGGIFTSAVTRNPVTFGWAATLEIPLWWSETPEGERTVPYYPPTPPPAPPPPPAAPPVPPVTVATAGMVRLEDALVEDGFEEVRVGRQGDRVVVEYENNRYNYDQSDGLYVVMKEIERSAVAAEPLTVVLKRHGLRLAEMEFPGNRPANGRFIPEATDFSLTPSERPAVWASPSPRNRVPLHTQLVLAPGLRTWVGTETGLFDFVLSFRPQFIIPFWPGLVGFVQADIPFLWSSGMADGGGLAYLRPSPVMQYALLQQTLGLGHGVMASVGGGLFATSYAGGLGEVMWAVGNGDLAFGVQGAMLWDQDYAPHGSVTGSIRYRFPPLDLVGSIQGGKFVGDDVGVSVELSRWFGNTQVGFFFTKSDFAVAGAFITIPLTLRRDMDPGYVQVRGSRRWAYQLGTRVGGGTNWVGGKVIGVSPTAPMSLESEYFDESRISLDGLVKKFE